jgi:putative nucleotidyltransferase with HDIG domain
MNALLGLSLESRTINEFLDRSLDLVLSLKWLAVESKGAIFLADKAGETLHLCVHKGLPKDLSAMCSTVPFGRCMCGRDAAARAVQFADRVDERHDTRYEGMSPHGHYCVPVLSGDHILGVINLYVKEGHTWSPWEEDFLKAVANTLAGTIERRRAEESLIETHEKLRQSWESTILVLASVAEMRDPYTAGHQQRVSELAQAIAQELGLPEAQVEGVRVAGLLHDLGKIQIPSETLSKPGKLTPIELMLIRTHSQSGYEILKPTVFPWPIAQFVLQHHERWDGSGYPAGLKGEEILLEARILAVADVVEAMSSHRPYRPAFGVHEALWEILQNKGTLYDAAVADACQRVFEERQFQFRSQVG